jgi:hypothetical protein
MREENQPKPPLPTWLTRFGGLVAGIWILAGAGWFIYRKLPVLPYSQTEKVLAGGVLFGMIAFVVNGLTLFRAKVPLPPAELKDFWNFLQGGAPADPATRVLWRKMLRAVLILAATAVSMALTVAANWLALLK